MAPCDFCFNLESVIKSACLVLDGNHEQNNLKNSQNLEITWKKSTGRTSQLHTEKPLAGFEPATFYHINVFEFHKIKKMCRNNNTSNKM